MLVPIVPLVVTPPLLHNGGVDDALSELETVVLAVEQGADHLLRIALRAHTSSRDAVTCGTHHATKIDVTTKITKLQA